MKRQDLDKMVSGGCSDPHCTHQHDNEPMFLAAKCHPAQGLDVQYKDGILMARCHVCESPVGNFEVA